MWNVAVVGATGAVGQELVRVLEHRDFPVRELRLLASPRSEGKTTTFRGEEHTIRAATPESFRDVDLALFSAGSGRSKELVPHAREAGALVVDNTSAFRLDPEVPLVIPEVNGERLRGQPGIVANPNCVTAILAVSVAPLRQLATMRRLVVSTYQSASGAGAAAMEDLLEQTRASLDGEEVVPKVLKHPYAFNIFSHDSDVADNGYNGEENKVVAETSRILDDDDLGVSITCVRVPVLRAHAESINVEFDRPVQPEDARHVLGEAPGLRLVDEPAENHFPMPVEASDEDDVLVGRIRRDPSRETALNLFACGDQLLKGAALNAVQIAEALVRR